MNVMKVGKSFKEYSDTERAWMILCNHPIYQAHVQIEQSINDECILLDSMSQAERDQYFEDMQLVDNEEWDV